MGKIIHNGVQITREISAENRYSTSEIEIGKWIDNKPLYRIVKQETLPTLSGSWQQLSNVSNLNINKIIDIKGIDITTNRQYPRYESSNFYLQFDYNNGYIRINGKGYSGTIYLIIEYTKSN